MRSQSKGREAQNNPIIRRRRCPRRRHGPRFNERHRPWKTSSTSGGFHVWVNHQHIPDKDTCGLRTHVFANFRWSRRGLVNSFLPRYARSRWLRAVLETIMDYGRRSLARLVVGYTGGKEGFRTRWKIYGGAVDKLCFISRDVIFIKAAGRCLLPPYTPVVGVVSRAMYGVYITKYTMLRWLPIQLFISRYTDARRINSTLMDLLKRVKIDFLYEGYLSYVNRVSRVYICLHRRYQFKNTPSGKIPRFEEFLHFVHWMKKWVTPFARP